MPFPILLIPRRNCARGEYRPQAAGNLNAEVTTVIRMDRTGVQLLGEIGLEWGTLGLGLAALLVTSPTARKTARSLAVAAMAGGLKLAHGVAAFGGQVREGVTRTARPQMMHPEAPAELHHDTVQA